MQNDSRNVRGLSLLCHSCCLLFSTKRMNISRICILIRYSSWLIFRLSEFAFHMVADEEMPGAAVKPQQAVTMVTFSRILMMIPRVAGWSRPACRATSLQLSVKLGCGFSAKGQESKSGPDRRSSSWERKIDSTFYFTLYSYQFRKELWSKTHLYGVLSKKESTVPSCWWICCHALMRKKAILG